MADHLYELHITVNVADAEVAGMIARDLHWKTSQIDGDPVLGHRPFFYLTTYTKTMGEAFKVMAKATRALREGGIAILREKIEYIVHDVRY